MMVSIAAFALVVLMVERLSLDILIPISNILKHSSVKYSMLKVIYFI